LGGAVVPALVEAEPGGDLSLPESTARRLLDGLTMSSKRIVHIQESGFRNESRVLKEAGAALRAGFAQKVVLLGYRREGEAELRELGPGLSAWLPVVLSAVPPPTKFHTLARVLRRWSRLVACLQALQPSLIHCHSVGTLPVAVWLRRRLCVPVVYDAHELEIDCGQNRRQAMVDRVVERTLVRRVSEILVVNDSIADWYRDRYRIPRPTVVRNIPEQTRQFVGDDRTILRGIFGIPRDALVFIYQGALFPGRRIEQFVRVFRRAGSGRHLVIMGYGELEGVAREAAAECPNIHFLPAVSPGEVLRHTCGADVGLAGVENTSLSYYFSLPNKLFEYLAAGVPAMVPGFPEMRRIIEANACGWVVGEGDDDWLDRIRRLTPGEIAAGRDAATRAMRSYSWANEEAVLLDTYQRLLRPFAVS
jgi:glycosyltransferase involved in cell wall biosynthesis